MRGGGALLLALARGAERQQQMERGAALRPVSRADSGLVISVVLLLSALTFQQAAGEGASPLAAACAGQRWGSGGSLRAAALVLPMHVHMRAVCTYV